MQTGQLPRTDESTAPRAGAREWVALAVLMLPVLLVSIDNTVLAFALPQIALALEPDAAQQLWLVDAYALVLAGLLVAMGSMGDRFGRRRMLLIGATGFALVSALAAFAPTAEALIAARAALGFFGAMLMPSTLSLLRSTFQHRDQRRLAIAVWATAFSVGSAIGPTVGGVLLQHFAWGSVFLMAVPVLLPLLVLAPLLVRESRDPNPGRIDLVGIALSIVALGALAAAIKHVAVDGPDLVALALVVASVVAGIAFVRRMQRSATPMLDIDLLRIPAFSGAIAINLLSVVALVGALFFLTQHLQLVEGMSTLDAALLLVPGTIAMVATGLGVVRIVRHLPARVVIAIGLSSSVAGYLLVAISGEHLTPLLVAVAYLLLGAGIGAAETLSNEIVVSTAPPAKAGAASAVSETAYELGAVLGTAVLGGIVSAVYRSTIELPEGLAAADASAARETLAGALDVADRVQGELGAAVAEAARTAFDHGALWTSLAGAALVLAAIVVALRALRRA
ncbi:MFS transporter [Agrococcus sp. SL85]|uniref:MFS transporter n=1 Tax=Agrococcus sp. SL85 TaxID=2995141 RepID=UPI00226C8AE9|nr:MFS transporter [Agrococcus sp. SL85]WAC65375.1 MFS transporter [Agrococcus sp. SL85]